MRYFPLHLTALGLLACATPAQGISEGPEPNNTTATAAVLPSGMQGFGEIDTSGTDEDWFQITLPGDRDYLIWTGPGFVNQIGDTRVRLYAADGVTILTDADDGNTTTHGYYTVFRGTLTAGDYYVAVRGYSSSYSGSYTLDVVLTAPGTYVPAVPPLTTVAESAEGNDPRLPGGVATASNLFTLNSGNILVGAGGTTFTSTTGDYDFYELAIAAPVQLTIETLAGAAAPASPDTVVHLVDSTLTRLAYDDDSGAGALSRLVYTIATPGTYYVVVSGYNATTAVGNYLLQILGDLPPLPVGEASVVVQTGGCAGSAGVPTIGMRVPTSFPTACTEMPVLGSEFFADLTNMPADSAFLRMIGFQPRNPYFNLGTFGFPACDIELYAIGMLFTVASPTGDSFWGLQLPPDLAYTGLSLEMQTIVLDPSPTLGIAVSNRISLVCGITH